MVVVVSLILVTLGLMCLFDPDLVFMVVELDARLFGKVLKRSSNWSSLMRKQGILLVATGLVGFFIGLR